MNLDSKIFKLVVSQRKRKIKISFTPSSLEFYSIRANKTVAKREEGVLVFVVSKRSTLFMREAMTDSPRQSPWEKVVLPSLTTTAAPSGNNSTIKSIT